MKTYEEFAREAYTTTYGDIEEGWGSAARWALRGVRAVPGLGTAASLGYAGYKLAKGDKTGAALAAGSAIPGPVGYGFLAADIARDIARSGKSDKKSPTAQKAPTPSTTKTSTSTTPAAPQKAATPTTTKTSTPTTSAASKPVLSKLNGVEGTGVGKNFVAKKWTDAEKSRYSAAKSS